MVPIPGYQDIMHRFGRLRVRACDNLPGFWAIRATSDLPTGEFMNLRAGLTITAISAVTVLAVSATALAEDGERRRSDNSGRRIAVVIPGAPRVMPAAAVGVMPVSSSAKIVPVNRSAASERSDARPMKLLSSIGTPAAELSPEVKDAMDKGIVVAQGLSKIALRRASDVGAWVGTMWRQCNEVPLMSPATEFAAPTPPLGSMRPLSSAGRERQLYFTSERRLKTVVGQ